MTNQFFTQDQLKEVNIKGYDYKVAYYLNEINQNDLSLAIVLNSRNNISSKI